MADNSYWNILTPYCGNAAPAPQAPPSPDQFQYALPASGSPYGRITPVAFAQPSAQASAGNMGATAIPGNLAPFQGYPDQASSSVPTIEDILRAPPFGYSGTALGQIHQKVEDDVELPSKIMDGGATIGEKLEQPEIYVPLKTLNALYQAWAPQMTDQRYNDTLWKSLNDRLIQQSEGPNVPPILRGIL